MYLCPSVIHFEGFPELREQRRREEGVESWCSGTLSSIAYTEYIHKLPYIWMCILRIPNQELIPGSGARP